ncbi:MAG: primase [Pseudomonadota bacterium]
MSLSPQWLDELRARVSLSGVIGRTTRLIKHGHEFKACCPFHNEKSPSFTVNDAKGFYHCLAGETRVITDKGRIAIRDLAGSRAKILSRGGKWIEAEFRNYGVQPLLKIELSRNRQRKTLYATAEHRWFVRGRKSDIISAELKPGHRLLSAFPEQRSDWTIDPEGVRHGIVFGDGTLFKGTYGTVSLHGAKDHELAKYFPDQNIVERWRAGGQSFLKIYGGRAFGHMKRLPSKSASDAYLLGFLAGYLAADGHVAKDGTIMLNSSSADILEDIRDIATQLGIATYGRTTQIRKGLGKENSALHRIHFVGSSLNHKLFLLSEARVRFINRNFAFERNRWQVVSVSPSDRVETVYCAEVPDEHAFALEDNILTGNCFGCGAHGDVIRWLTDQRGMSFMDAVKDLAAEANLELPAPDPKAAQRAEQQAGLHDVMAAAQDYFVAQLAGAEGAKARAYLATRGFDAHTVARFGFGYAPEGRQALKAALSAFPEGQLIEAGLRIAVDDKEPYDRFRGRLMLPIHDARGRVIAFGGRILDAAKTDAPKYLNSPDTPLFDKGRTLYNLYRAGPASRQSGRMIVVEGYMDVIALAAAGIHDAVAPLGTALTERQIEMLWRLVETPLLCFDGDAAGQKAAMRAVTRTLPLLRPAHSLRIVRLPTGMDPDDVVKRDGTAAMERLLDGAQALLEVLWSHERDAQSLDTPEDKAGLKARLMTQVELIEDADIKALYRRELLERFSDFAFPKRESHGQWQGSAAKPVWQPQKRGGGGIWNRGPLPSPPEHAPRLRHAISGGSRRALTAAVIAGLIRYPQEIARHAEVLSRIEPHDARLDALLDATMHNQRLESQTIDTIFADMRLNAPEPAEYGDMRFGFLAADVGDARAEAELAEAIALLVEAPAIEAALAAATARFEVDPEGAFAEQQRLLKRKLEFDARLRQMGANT